MIPLVTIVLPGPPRGKGRPRFGQGRTFTDRKTEKFEEGLRWRARVAMGAQAPLTGAVELLVIARFAVPASWSKKKRAAALSGEFGHTSKPDFDNLLKTVDALNKIVWHDDSQVVRAVIEKVYAEEPATIIHVGRPELVACL